VRLLEVVGATATRPPPCATIAFVTWRRLLIPAVLLLIVISAVSATNSNDTAPDAPTTPAPPAAPAPEVKATLPRTAPLHASVGDVVRLTVKAPADDTVALDELGVEAPVDEGVAAQVVFVADRAGRFPVRLRDAGESIGTVVVS
jgi:hypothetical protein